jgi:hypothetical protein
MSSENYASPSLDLKPTAETKNCNIQDVYSYSYVKFPHKSGGVYVNNIP